MLGPYIIQQRLGDNALGQVFKARHQHMNRMVSLTVVREDLLAQPEAVPQFYQEVQAVSQLTHPHIVCAYDAGPIGKTHFFAQEYVEGIDLEKLVQQTGPLPLGPALTLMRQTALGLQHAFERRLLHHDLRPANLLVTRFAGQADPTRGGDKTPQPNSEELKQAQIKISNLGLTMLQAKPRQGKPSADGLFDFAAPETNQTAKLFDIRSNLYNLGCIFYFLLAGKVPFPGGEGTIKLRKHQIDEAPPLSSLRNDVPPAIEEVIRKLMAKRPENRFQTPGELLAALGGSAPTMVGGPSEQYPTTSLKGDPTSVQQRVIARGGVGPAILDLLKTPKGMLAGGGVLLLLICFIWLLSRGGGGEPPRKDSPVKATPLPPAGPRYVKKATKEESILATLAASGLPSFQGKWYWIGPFDSPGNLEGFERVYPPQTEIDLKKSYDGKNKQRIGWKELPDFQPGKPYDFKKGILPGGDQSCIYLYHEFEVARPMPLVVSFGSDDSLQVWLNGQLEVQSKGGRGVAPDQDFATLNLKPGRNQLLVKVCNGTGGFGFYLMPRWPSALETSFGVSLNRDFPAK